MRTCECRSCSFARLLIINARLFLPRERKTMDVCVRARVCYSEKRTMNIYIHIRVMEENSKEHLC